MLIDGLTALADIVLQQDHDESTTEGEEIVNPAADESLFKCEKFVMDKTNGGTDVGKKLILLHLMAVGQKGNDLEGFALDDTPFNKLPKEFRMKVAARHLNDEIIRRGEAYVSIEKKKPNQWTNNKRFQWLENNPIPNEYKEELKYIECEWLKMKQFCTEVIEKNKRQMNSGEAKAVKKKWDTNMPWLRLFLCFTVDCVKEAFLLRHQAMNREELDALNTSMQ